MQKPYVILHMLTSIDGKVTGEYLSSGRSNVYCEEYYRIHREYYADAFVCGRITMEGSFTHEKQPYVTPFLKQKTEKTDYVAKKSNFYAVAIDPHGRLGWESADIRDDDPGYDEAHIIEVLTEQASEEYVAFLKNKGISYIFCGKEKLDVALICQKLYDLFGIKKLLLEGGGMTDTLFFEADAIDEISLVVAPMIDGSRDGVDLFAKKQKGFKTFESVTAVPLPAGGLWLNYKKS